MIVFIVEIISLLKLRRMVPWYAIRIVHAERNLVGCVCHLGVCFNWLLVKEFSGRGYLAGHLRSVGQ